MSRFPVDLHVAASMSECRVDAANHLRYRDRRWVPENEPLRSRLMQDVHDSYLTGHPGKNTKYAILARSVYWPCMAKDVQRFVSNCDKCGTNTVWRSRRHGLLKPLPIPERKWRKISIDFIEKIPCLVAAVT